VRVALYARVSSEDQRERQTIRSQTEYAEKRATLDGWTLSQFLDDGVSGTLPLAERPAGARLLAAARANQIDLVVTYRVDRLGRTLRVVLNAIDSLMPVPFASLTEPFETNTPLGRAMLQIVGVFAELERETFLERSRIGTDRAARQDGRWLGGIVPYGYLKRDDLRLAIDERPMANGLSQADVVREVFRLCGDAGWSTTRIAQDLNARGIPTAYGAAGREYFAGELHGTRSKAGKRKRTTAGRWSAGAVLRMLHNETYAGRHSYGRRSSLAGRELVARAMPPIVSPALFEKAQQRLTHNLQWDKAHPRHSYVLRGLLTCECGHMLIGTSYETKAGHVTQYRCGAHPESSRPLRVYAKQAEEALWSDVVDFIAHPDDVARNVARGLAGAAPDEERAERNLLALAGELRGVKEREARALDLRIRDLVSADVLSEKLAEIRNDRTDIERRMAAVRSERARAATSASEGRTVAALLRTLETGARNASPETRSEVLRVLVGSAVASWDGDTVRLRVTYSFGRPSLALIPSTNTGSSRPPASRARDRSRPQRRARA
jgi:site-specific DNA recombinase